MLHTADRLEFAPPPTAGLLRALGLAILAHIFLLAALTWGVNWKRSAEVATAQAELWSALPQTAAPSPVEARVVPPAAVKPAPPPGLAAPKADPDIALERDQLRLKKEQQQAAQRMERRENLEKLQALETREKERREKQKLALEQQRAQNEKSALETNKNKQEAKRKKSFQAQQDAQKLEAQRQANLQRMARLAGSSATPAAGTALQSAAPSASYGAKVVGTVKPRIAFTPDPVDNPTAVVEVRAAPDGRITSRKLLKASGNKFWDDAVLKAIDKTVTLPPDDDGRVPPVLEIIFRPRG